MTQRKSDSDYIGAIPGELAVIPIHDGVVFPYMLVPLVLSDANLIGLIDEALSQSKIVGVFTQSDTGVAVPGPDEIHHAGCAMLLQKMARFPDGHVRIIGQGLARIEIAHFTDDPPLMRARVRVLDEPPAVHDRARALMLNVVNAFIRLVDSSEGYPDELKGVVSGIQDPGRLADLAASNINIGLAEKQQVLERLDPIERLRYVYELIAGELEIARIGEKIRRDVQHELTREQREYYLRQQIKAIRKELGDEDAALELDELRARIEAAAMPAAAREAAERELGRVARMSPQSAEYSVALTYLEWLLDLPWEESTVEEIDIRAAGRILDRDHYDLDAVKERILEHLSVRKLRRGERGSLLCFTGPPGVGKTSLGISIAAALGRKFVRISLGGIRDEAEIRGHRRTYVGALPGRIIQGIRTAGSNNPVFMLDEIDKLGQDFRGDPAAALLEVLDPQQNNTFEDHYINVPFDLSRVMFIATANIRDTIPPPLLDRMETIDLPGYITHEKIEIARRFLIPRQLAESGVPPRRLSITDEAVETMVERYTREAGVRNLERMIGAVARRAARRIVEGSRGPFRVTPRNLRAFLGARDFPQQRMLDRPEIGVATGMARTAAGGEILFVEALAMSGSGEVRLTGQLGEVMKESAQAAVSYVRARFAAELLDEKFFEKSDIHLHIPAGAVPKDGPSAGVAIAVALASLATGRPVRNDVAMTGEITLTGKVLAVGAVKEKVIAAHRAGIRTVIAPAANGRDLEEVPAVIEREMNFELVETIDEGIAIAVPPPASGRGGRTRRKYVGKTR